MKIMLRLLLLLPFIAVLPAARAADVSGTWKGAFDFQGTSVPLTIHLNMDGTKVAGMDDMAKVTGTVEGLETSPAEIHEGILHGEYLSFWLNTDYQGQTYKLVYKGKVTADGISFDFGTEEGSWSTTMTVKKDGEAPAPAAAAPAAPDVTGDWTGTFDMNGTPTELKFHLKSAGNAVTGTVERPGAPPSEVHEGKIEGDTVSFWMTTDYEGNTYTIVYKGKITAEQIDFDFGTADQSWSSQVTAKKS
jgi:hypothetical protein